mgnify:FL=1
MDRPSSEKTNFNRNKSTSRQAQITIFMIMGILILFAFLMVIFITGQFKEGQLKAAQEETISKLFQKEALRIFVEDCLADELEQGLLLIGKQGRLWDDQPGGRITFEEGVTGKSYPPGTTEEKIFYAITNKLYPLFPQAYPCKNDSTPEEFCRYEYPNTQLKFGELEIQKSTIEADLRRFLTDKAQWCVETFVKNKVSSSLEVETEGMDLQLQIFPDGIDVNINYPLKFSVGQEEFFHLSTFDFFYPSKFGELLKAAVDFPLGMDLQFVDFNYDEEVIESPAFTYGSELSVRGCSPAVSQFKNYFLCSRALYFDLYSSLGIEMEKTPLDKGDDLFVFKSLGILDQPEKYLYRFIRQNRPPALDYVNREGCPRAGYDYLVVKDVKDNPELGKINITLFAVDPDEDEVVKYDVKGDFGTQIGPKFSMTPVKEGLFNLKATAVDEHGLSDWQKVRVLVDRPMVVDFSLDTNYKIDLGSGLLPYEEAMQKMAEGMTDGYYVISNEDPIFVRVSLPENSLAPGESKVTFTYTAGEKAKEIGLAYNDKSSKENCYAFPSRQGEENLYTCNLKSYSESELKKWPELLKKAELSPFQDLGTGVLELAFSQNYCIADRLSNSKTATVVIKQCIPHINLTHPFAYNPSAKTQQEKYHEYKFVEDEEGNYVWKGEFEPSNPFLATHSCCNSKFELKTKEDEPCFINPEPSCAGQVKSKLYKNELGEFTDYTALKKGLVWEEQRRYCDGTRGNLCNGDFENKLYHDQLWCGIPGKNACTGGSEGINSNCQDGPAFRFVDKLVAEKPIKGWCYGAMGCQKFCTAPNAVVYSGDPAQLGNFDTKNLNALALKNEITNLPDPSFPFHCSCISGLKEKGFDDGRPCDANFDGQFKGKCQAGKCVEGG